MEERGWSKDEVLEAIAKHDRRVVVYLMYKVITVYPKTAEMRRPYICSATNCTNSCKKEKVLCGLCQKNADKAAKKNKQGGSATAKARKKKEKAEAKAKARKKKEKAEAKRLDKLEKLADEQALLEYQAHTRANAIAKQFCIQV